MFSDRTLSRFSSGIGDRGLRIAGELSVPLYRLTRGRIGGHVGRAPVLLLTTTGRKSGEPRTAPVLYIVDGDRLVSSAPTRATSGRRRGRSTCARTPTRGSRSAGSGATCARGSPRAPSATACGSA